MKCSVKNLSRKNRNMADESMESDLESLDSDKELQDAFARGLVKPGLNIVQKVPVKEAINNVQGLNQALEEIKSDLPWVERFDLTLPPLAPPKPMREQLGEDPDDLSQEAVHDDFKREMKFYRLAQAACLEALPRLQSMGIPTRRPEDYFAEMSKSDGHMKKVRQKLLAKQISMERSEKAKKMRDQRKYGKKVQQEVLQKRQKEKKEMLESVKKYRKGEESRLSFLDDKDSGGKGQQKGKDGQINPKRAFKNKKFGFGGQKKRSKGNTKQSSNELTSYSGQKHSNMKGKPKPGNKNRPGKARRRATNNKKK